MILVSLVERGGPHPLDTPPSSPATRHLPSALHCILSRTANHFRFSLGGTRISDIRRCLYTYFLVPLHFLFTSSTNGAQRMAPVAFCHS